MVKFMNKYLDIFIRVSVAFIVLLIIIKIIGKKQLSQINIITYITSIAIGNIAGNLAVHPHVKIIPAVFAMCLWGFFIVTVEHLGLKNRFFFTFINSTPTIIISKGQIIYKNLKKSKLTLDDVLMLLRKNNIFSILDVDYAVWEPTGELNVIKKFEQQNPTNQDLNILSTSINNYSTPIILSGTILFDNLKNANKDEKWLFTELSMYNINSEKDILYAEITKNNTLYFQKK